MTGFVQILIGTALVLFNIVTADLGKYDIIIIPIPKLPVRSQNVIELTLSRHPKLLQSRSPVIDDGILKLDISDFVDPTETPNIDSYEYNDKEDSRSVLTSFFGDDKIVGGQEVDINLYPYHVAYGTNCGGAIIDKKWVMTAGHCGKKPYVRVGSKYLNQGKKILIQNTYVHPMWSAKNKDHPFDYDFQLLELAESLRFNENIQPINVARIEDMVVGKVATVTGWGNTEENGPYSDILRAVRVPIISKENCQQVAFPYFRGSLTPRMFCAGFQEGKKDACQGDSGGPAVAHDRLLGMVSFGYGCATPGSYGVYSKVAKVRPWIKEITGLDLE